MSLRGLLSAGTGLYGDQVGRMIGTTADTVRQYTKRASAYRIAIDVTEKVTAISPAKMGR